MNIGVLTFHKAINYGSVLQAWSTTDMLRKMGHTVEIIDYEPDVYKAQKTGASGNVIKKILRRIAGIPVDRIKQRKQANFQHFREINLQLSEYTLDSESSYEVLENRYDCLICGSDQIWNVHAFDCDDIFFLPNVKNRKIALSVSINNTNFSESRCNEEMKRWISDFSFISCREENGAERIRTFLDHKRDVFTLLDPTLLHIKEDFYPLCSDRLIAKPYIFLYKVWSGKDSYKIVSQLGKKLKLPVYTLFMYNNVVALCKVELAGIKVETWNTGPSDYLSLIRYAEYVVTDSFHGTAFSIIFEKKFYCVREKKKDGTEKKDDRLLNVLQLFGLKDRYIAINEMNTYRNFDEIDYSIVTEKRLSIAKDNIDLIIKAIISD